MATHVGFMLIKCRLIVFFFQYVSVLYIPCTHSAKTKAENAEKNSLYLHPVQVVHWDLNLNTVLLGIGVIPWLRSFIRYSHV
jgi:hypothetical protein